jgi:organic radical activating enzyme
MNKLSSFFAILCTVCLVSCSGGNPQEIVGEYYTLIKQADYEKAAEITVEHFWKFDWADKSQIDDHREEVINQKVDELKKEAKKERLPKDFAILDVTAEADIMLVKVRETYSDNDFDCVYKFVKDNGKWIASEKEFVSEAGRDNAWYRIKDSDAKVTLYSAPDTGAEVVGHINSKTHLKGYPGGGAFMVRKTDIEGWGAVVKDVWEYPEWNHGNGIYKGDVTCYVNRAELTANAKPER